MTVNFAPEAIEDLSAAIAFLGERNLSAAVKLSDRIFGVIMSLAEGEFDGPALCAKVTERSRTPSGTRSRSTERSRWPPGVSGGASRARSSSGGTPCSTMTTTTATRTLLPTTTPK